MYAAASAIISRREIINDLTQATDYTNISLMAEAVLKQIVWVGPSRHDLLDFPDGVQSEIGYALYQAQLGGKHPSAKPMGGYRGAGLLEIVEDDDGNTYRAVY